MKRRASVPCTSLIQAARLFKEKRTPMPLNAFMLVMAAAAMHAGWNFIVKQVGEKQIFTWLAVMLGALCYLPLLATGGPVPTNIWPYALSSALAEAAYFIVLVWAYDQGDFSLVYPIGRGAAPGILAIWAVIFLGEQPQFTGMAGIGVLLLGISVVGGGSWWIHGNICTLSIKGVGSALTLALCISVYSAIDAAAVRIMEPAAYTVLVLGLTGILLMPYVLARFGYRLILREWNSHWGRISLVGILMILTYILVLHAYAFARISYVAALREVSIVLAALAGWRWLGEEFGAVRTTGAVLIFFGILVIAVSG